MEKINVKEEFKSAYLGLIRTAQQMEQSIGASEYRLYKLKGQREQIDVDLKTWWDNVAEEYKLDKALDYYVDNDGAINQVEKPAAPAAPEAPVDPDVVAPEIKEEAPTPAEPVDNKEGGSAADLT